MCGNLLKRALYRKSLAFFGVHCNTFLHEFWRFWTNLLKLLSNCLCSLEMTRHVSMISISLSTRELNKNSPGYAICCFSCCIHMHKDVVEVEEEEEGVGEEATVGLLDMRIIREAMATIRGDMAITKVDMAIIKPDMVDMAMIKKMVDGTLTGVEVVDVVEAIGIIVVSLPSLPSLSCFCCCFTKYLVHI
ncbi:hypothetical protein BHE74_00001181 [Ensete ventricosum]|nr:hypothetical protein BHE74_00001181 [Ensete ventricosum]